MEGTPRVRDWTPARPMRTTAMELTNSENNLREATMRTALLIIDIQNDYFPGGAMELDGSEAAGAKAGELLAALRDRQTPVFHIQHISPQEGATFFLPDTKGADIHDCVKPLADEITAVKHFPNSFRDTGLLDMLEKAKVEHLVVCGMMTLMCVDATVRAAFDLGFSVTVVADACAARALEFDGRTVAAADVHAAFLAALGMVYAEITTTEKYLASLDT